MSDVNLIKYLVKENEGKFLAGEIVEAPKQLRDTYNLCIGSRIDSFLPASNLLKVSDVFQQPTRNLTKFYTLIFKDGLTDPSNCLQEYIHPIDKYEYCVKNNMYKFSCYGEIVHLLDNCEELAKIKNKLKLAYYSNL